MSTTAIVWLILVGGLAVCSLFRAVYGFSLYLLTFYLFPAFWWWGRPLPDLRWNLAAGIVFLLAVVLQGTRAPVQGRADPGKHIAMLAVAILVNATIVHVLFAPSLEVSMSSYIQLLKYVVLFFLIVAAVRNPADLRLALLSIVLGAAYLGFEVTVNDRGFFRGGRLEGIGAAGVDNANQLASLMATVLPLAGALFFWGGRKEKWLVAITGPLILNVILSCSSRGALLALTGGTLTFLTITTKSVRRKALLPLGLAGLAAFLLLGDDRIVERFSTIFYSAEERDESASGRLVLWKAGFKMVRDHPLGAGGDGFKRAYASQYLPDVGIDAEARSVHNGILNEACEWGIQGFTLRMFFIGLAVLMTRRIVRQQSAAGNVGEAALGCSLIASAATFVLSCLFGDYLDEEWGYWVTALMVAYARLYHTAAVPAVQPAAAPAPLVATAAGRAPLAAPALILTDLPGRPGGTTG